LAVAVAVAPIFMLVAVEAVVILQTILYYQQEGLLALHLQ